MHFSPPVELIDRIAALVPPPRIHRQRHRYFGVLAPLGKCAPGHSVRRSCIAPPRKSVCAGVWRSQTGRHSLVTRADLELSITGSYSKEPAMQSAAFPLGFHNGSLLWVIPLRREW